MQEKTKNNSPQEVKRPEGLTLLCILSFVGGGLSFVSNFMIFAFYNQFIALIESDKLMNIPNIDFELLVNLVKNSGRAYYILVAGLYLVSLYGVYQMWYLQKKGIHYYAVAQIILLIVPLLLIDRSLSVFPGLIISGLFIFVYSRYLKIMK
jgi:hypothetical protein